MIGVGNPFHQSELDDASQPGLQHWICLVQEGARRSLHLRNRHKNLILSVVDLHRVPLIHQAQHKIPNEQVEVRPPVRESEGHAIIWDPGERDRPGPLVLHHR